MHIFFITTCDNYHAFCYLAIGDLLGPSLEGLENLLKLPYGCGEQNMLNFAPGVSIAKYLIETDQLDFMQAVKDKAIKVLQTG